MEDRIRTDLDIESEILRIKRRRETAESSESRSKPEDYVVLCGKYRAVSQAICILGTIDSHTVVGNLIFHLMISNDGSCPLQVRPYFFDFVCSVKQRNAGLGIIDVFCKVSRFMAFLICWRVFIKSSCVYPLLSILITLFPAGISRSKSVILQHSLCHGSLENRRSPKRQARFTIGCWYHHETSRTPP